MVLVNAPESSRHLDADDIEKYSLGDISEDSAAELEEHLLTCQACRDRVTESDRYVQAVRNASRQLLRESAVRQSPAWLHWRMWALAAALLVLAVTVAVLRPGATHPEFAVSLSAMRGADLVAKAPAGAVLVLHPDLTGIPAPPPYRLRLVDAVGSTVWQGASPAARVSPRHAGAYYLRLYSSGGELLREYGLTVE